ncbi:hypothetical protein TNCV_1194231 [Trichonephila clavipes]|nr:hypothetical protein TNCV_1194231 [Trichonephila clavipes]
MTLHTIIPSVGEVCHCKTKAELRCLLWGLLHTIVITAEIESGFIVKDDLVPLRCSPVPTHSNRRGRWVEVMGVAIPNVFQPGAFIWFEKTLGPLVKMLPVPGCG